MIVSDQTLKKLLLEGAIVIEPLEDHQIQPASIDLRLGNHFLKVDENRMEAISFDRELEYIEFKREEIIIPPHSFLLAMTREYIRLPSGRRICQIVFALMDGPAGSPYKGKYQNQREAVGSRFFLNQD